MSFPALTMVMHRADAEWAQDGTAERTDVLRGREAIRGCAGVVEEFLAGCVDAESLGTLSVWMRDAMAQGGVPLAALSWSGGRMVAVMLAMESRVFGVRSGLAEIGNVTGQRGFFVRAEMGAEERRARMLAAADALVQRAGLAGVMMSLKVGDVAAERGEASLLGSRVVAVVRRAIYDTFDLEGSFDLSVASLGAHTRRNLRYYRRRAQHELGCEFFPELKGADLRDAVLDLHRHTQDAMPAGVVKNRIAHVARREDAFCMGVRANDGRWLSWVSGWRRGGQTYIDWQCNRGGLARYSLSTVMRAHLIEFESLRAQEQLRFLGGTPHTMHYGFREEMCTDWLLRRPGLRGFALERTLRGMAWLRERMERPGHEPQELRTRAARRHRVVGLMARMVGVIRKAKHT